MPSNTVPTNNFAKLYKLKEIFLVFGQLVIKQSKSHRSTPLVYLKLKQVFVLSYRLFAVKLCFVSLCKARQVNLVGQLINALGRSALSKLKLNLLHDYKVL